MFFSCFSPEISHFFPQAVLRSLNGQWYLEISIGVLLLPGPSVVRTRCVPAFVVGQSLSHVLLFATPWTAAHQASLSLTNSQSLLKFTSIQSVMTYNHLVLCYPLLFLPSIFPRIRVFSNESILHTRWPKYWSFSFSISPSIEYSGLNSFRIDYGLIFLLSQVFSSTTV